jgi:hypothetical protein
MAFIVGTEIVLDKWAAWVFTVATLNQEVRMDKRAKVVAEADYGYLLLKQETEGHSGARYKDKETLMKVRRVDPDGDDHVQIEISVREYHHSGATRSMHSTLSFDADSLAKLLQHLSKPWAGLKR